MVQEGQRQRARRARNADRLAHQEIERGERIGQRRVGLALEDLGIEKPRQQCLLVGPDRAHVLADHQGDLGGVPVAAAREAEHPRGQGRRQRRVLPQRVAGRLRGVEQQADVEPAAEKLGRLRAGAVDQRPSLFQRTHLQQPVDARDEQRPVVGTGPRRIGFREQQVAKERARGRNAVVGMVADQARGLAGPGRSPEIARKTGRLRREQTHRVAPDGAERCDGDLLAARRRGLHRRLWPRRRHEVVGADALRKPGNGAARLARGTRRSRSGGEAGCDEPRCPPDHFASTGMRISRVGAGRSREDRKSQKRDHGRDDEKQDCPEDKAHDHLLGLCGLTAASCAVQSRKLARRDRLDTV